MSRLTEAQEAAQELAVELDRTEAAPFLEPIRAALRRMAQLEKVAELARLLTDDRTDPQRAEWARTHLGIALTELDNHPDTREPTTTEETPR